MPPTDGMTAGGIWPAIVGTFYLMLGSAVFAFPVGVMSGIYMSEHAPQGKVVSLIRMMTNNLAGIPSIVFGLFGMAFFVNYMDFGDSILAGSLTLGLLALPIVIRTTEEACRDIAGSYREGSLAFGSHARTDYMEGIAPHGRPASNNRAHIILGPRIGRDRAHTVYLRGIFPAQAAARHFRPVHGAPLPLVRGSHERNRHRRANAHCLRRGVRAHRPSCL